MRRVTLPCRLSTFIIVAIIAAGCTKRFPEPGDPIALQATSVAAAATQSLPAPRPADLPDFSGLVETYGMAVVNISLLEHSGNQSRNGNSAGESDPLYDFFRRFGVPFPDQEEPPSEVRALGSGFIVSSDGYILTNAHVVRNAAAVTVKLTDRREFSAKVIGADALSDVAVLKIEAQQLPVVKLGDAGGLKAGQWVVAIGAPFGFENSVTVGVVSGTARSLPAGGYVPFIQTDVAVNPGNSGGPLFNLQGEVVGINSQIYSRSGGYMGISFAIPIDVARGVEEELVKNGHVRRGRIGVTVQDMNAQFAESFGMDRARGALVNAVEKDGPAAKAGIKPGDVILRINGQDIDYANQLAIRIAAIKPGEPATLGVWRNRKTVELKVNVGELKETNSQGKRSGKADEPVLLGLSVRSLTAEEREALATDGTLVVTVVSGAAAAAGVIPGDVILAVSGNPVRTIDELREGVRRAERVVALLIQRGDTQIFIPISIEQRSSRE